MQKQLLELILSGHPVNTDTRKIKSGDVFFALKGRSFNGNTFTKQALEMGAISCVVDEKEAVIDERCILVENSLESLQKLAHTYRKTFNIPFILIAGSNGKTTSKELIYHVLQKKYRTFATHGNYNNHIGVPLTLLSIPKNTEIAVIEIGANHALEHAFLCNIIEPTHALITNNGKDHLEGFGSIEGVIKANNEVYEYIRTQKGHVFVNQDDVVLLKNSEDLSRTTYGINSQANISGGFETKTGPLEVWWQEKGQKYESQTKLMGSYNVNNILLAVAVGRHFKVNHSGIQLALEEYKPANNRSQWLKVENQHIILDAYNANPSSMQSAIDSLFQNKTENKLLVLGDMAELGAHSSQEHLNILNLIKTYSKSQDQVVLVGKNFAEHQTLFPFTFLPNREEAIKTIQKLIQNPYLWLVKGSRSSKMEEVVYGVFPELKKLS